MQTGLQLVDYTWPGGSSTLASDLASVARAAEGAGFSSLSVADHLWQQDRLGPPESPVLEAYTTLGFLAAHTSRINLHAMVSNIAFREPGLLAKAVTTLDVLSGGRSALALGAGWNGEEAAGLGIPFPATAERMERLEETAQICLQMWSDSDESYEGVHYKLGRTLNSPQPLTKPRPKLIIGGAGEKKTLRLVARYADSCNIHATPDAEHKLDVLREFCEQEGRDYADIEKTTGVIACTPTTTVDPGALLDRLRGLHDIGFTNAYLMVPGLPLEAIDVLAESVIPEVVSW
jgi:alkanesulfonate monooxygenase